MPQRYIKVPIPITIIDPKTKLPSPDPAETFPNFVDRLMNNPMWNESAKAMRAADAIVKAAQAAEVMVLAEEDWMLLRDCAETPRQVLYTPLGPQTSSGFGFHPSVSRQFLPFVDAISGASTSDPRPQEQK